MMECFLVVALEMNERIITRTLSYLDNVPAQRIEFTMAIEAGRRSGHMAIIQQNPESYKNIYGYDCGEGWVNKGVAKTDVFDG